MAGEELESIDDSRISRRKALKVAAAAGVGAVAWSGPTITSMAGTPAYADACTFAVSIFLANNRNTAQGCAQTVANSLEFLPLDLGELPSGYSVSPNIVEGNKFCNSADRFETTLTFPEDVNCQVTVRLHGSQGNDPYFTSDTQYDFVFNGDGPTLDFYLPRADDYGSIISQTRFSVRLECVTIGQQDCFD